MPKRAMSEEGDSYSDTTDASADSFSIADAKSLPVKRSKSITPPNYPPALPLKTAVVLANARERDRSNSVNNAFVTLRTLIPTEPRDRKLSKIETLRLASSYIQHLNTVLQTGVDIVEQPCIKHPALFSRFYGMPCRMTSSVCTFCLSAPKISQSKKRRV